MKRLGAGAAIGVIAVMVLAGCGSTDDGASDGPSGTAVAWAPCPVDPLEVVVSVSQWGDVVEQLGGGCTEVTTIVEGGDVDPHDFEPSPADSAAFGDADLVVVNGLDYDHWAEAAVAAVSPEPAVVDGGEVVGLEEGDNPHIWYGPDYVQQVAEAVTTELKALAPDAAAYFDDQASAWNASLQPYLAEIASLEASASGTTYAATESVFAYMADAIGMVDETPQGYRNAAASESDPAPGDINAFQELLRGGTVEVLIYNSQTEGSVPEQLRSVAEGADVPVVEVSESVPPSAGTFVEWQLAQLRALSAALGG